MKKVLIILLVAFIFIQFFPIDTTNPPVNKGMDFLSIKHTPEPIAELIRTSCYDCHSNESRYPWYSNMAPASWLMKKHIDEGRKKLNFSTFALYEPKRQVHKLEEAVELLNKKEMPLESYLLMHQNARLTEEQNQQLIDYFKKILNATKENNAL